MMKVALFVHCFFPAHFYGTETYTLDLAKNLRNMGHDPVVVTGVFPGKVGYEKVTSLYQYDGIPVYAIDNNYLPPTRIRDTYYQPQMRALHTDLLARIKPDVVHVTHLMNHTAVLPEVTAELGIPTMATLTDFFGFCFTSRLEASDGSMCRGPNAQRTNCLACGIQAWSNNHRASLMSRWTSKHPWSSITAIGVNGLCRVPGLRSGKIADVVLDITKRPEILASCYAHYRAAIAPTRFLREAYMANGLKVPIYEMPFGVDLPRLSKPARNADAVITFGFIGQLAPHKGVDILIEAFFRLPKRSAELHVFGSEDQDPGYVASLKDRAVDHQVFFQGTFPQEKMGDVLSTLDFLVIPSRWYENSPLVLLNALASHTPVIVSDVDGLTEFVTDGVNGYVFSRGNANDLERILRSILKEPQKSRGMSGSTEYARTSRMMAEDVFTIYQSIR